MVDAEELEQYQAAFAHKNVSWLQLQALWRPRLFLAICLQLDVDLYAMPLATSLLKMVGASPATWEFFAARHARQQPVPTPIKTEPEPAPEPPPQPEPLQFRPRERCLDCGDFLPSYRHIPRCVRCNKVRLQALAQARVLASAAPPLEPPPHLYRCLICRKPSPMAEKGRRLCEQCFSERYTEQPDEDAVLFRTSGQMPHLAFYINRRGESVYKGRILPHRRYGESRSDYFGDSTEPDDG